MRFCLIDRILDLQPGLRVTATKTLRSEEDYLRDHFPHFPVMPGVLMLEALFQASMWLVRKSEDFAHAVVLLKEARNVKYADFVEPGQTLQITAEILKQDARTVTLKAEGRIGERVAVSGRLILERFNQADEHPGRVHIDSGTRLRMRRELERLCAAGA